MLNSKAALIAFAATSRTERQGRAPWKGEFHDTHTLATALTGQSLTLDRAAVIFGTEHCKLGGVEHGAALTTRYLDYAVCDVLVTQELHARLLDELARHPVGLSPSAVFSGASLAKAYINAFGISPPAERSNASDTEIGYFASAFYGGRAECRVRREVAAVTNVDVRSMYPTQFDLLGMSRFLLARTIDCEDATGEVRELLEGITLDDLFEPTMWSNLTAVVEVEPDGDILPIRAKYNGSTRSIGINYLSANRASGVETLWYSLPDLVASKLLTGKAPKVRRAIRLTSSGRLRTLRAVKLRNAVSIDPRRDEIFTRMIDERCRIANARDIPEPERNALSRALKTIANSGSYGIFAEMNRQPLAEPTTIDVFADRTFTAQVRAIERPGRFCFMPFATLITGGARLMLAMLETAVVEAGGMYVMCDTDSMAIVTQVDPAVSTHERRLGGRTDALSAATIAEILARFDSLSPYATPGGLWKVEDENFDPDTGEPKPLFAFAISAKRYALFNVGERGRITIRRALEHGLGTYRSPHQ